MHGYLATITSEAENNSLMEKVHADAWIGASDTTVEEQWRWVTGPEGDSVKYDLWFFNGSWIQIGNLLNTNSMAFTLPEDNTDSAMFRV